MAAFGARLRALRQAKGLLQKTLAIQLGVHQTFLSNVEKGHRLAVRRQLNDLPDELWTKINIGFYKDSADAVFKALVE